MHVQQHICCSAMLLARTPFVCSVRNTRQNLSSLSTIAARSTTGLWNVTPRVSGRTMAEISDVAPKVLSTVSLTINYSSMSIEDGQHVGKAQAAHAPNVAYTGSADKHYTLLMVDPDAPSPDNPTVREWLHWIVVNIPGSDVSKGFTVTDYAGPTPPRGTHRYIFLLYEQPPGVLLPNKRHEQRPKFNADKWAKAHQLGDPVAAAYFQTAAGE